MLSFLMYNVIKLLIVLGLVEEGLCIDECLVVSGEKPAEGGDFVQVWPF